MTDTNFPKVSLTVRQFLLSLRMNLYGWSLPAFADSLGSKNTMVLKAAAACLSEALPKEPGLSKARAWLHRLIESGFPLRKEREPASEPADGGLLTVLMETEVHVFAVYSIARAIGRDEYLNLSGDSSHWTHPSVGSLYRELAACGFTRSEKCCAQYFTWMSQMSNGSPLFGDDFRTQWSFYTLFSNQELAAMIPVFQAAVEFKRRLPEGYPKEVAKNMAIGLSEGGMKFMGDLMKWFSQIHQAGQDAFILWW